MDVTGQNSWAAALGWWAAALPLSPIAFPFVPVASGVFLMVENCAVL